MTMPIQPRELSTTERALLMRLLADASFSGAEQLATQVATARVTGGLPTLLDLEVPRVASPADIADGPVPVRAFVEASAGDVEGEILVWVTDGYLSGLEVAWYTDAPPPGMPSPDRLRVD
jgi:hypothetical protein